MSMDYFGVLNREFFFKLYWICNCIVLLIIQMQLLSFPKKASKLVRLVFGKGCFSSTKPKEKPSETNWKTTLFVQSV